MKVLNNSGSVPRLKFNLVFCRHHILRTTNIEATQKEPQNIYKPNRQKAKNNCSRDATVSATIYVYTIDLKVNGLTIKWTKPYNKRLFWKRTLAVRL